MLHTASIILSSWSWHALVCHKYHTVHANVPAALPNYKHVPCLIHAQLECLNCDCSCGGAQRACARGSLGVRRRAVQTHCPGACAAGQCAWKTVRLGCMLVVVLFVGQGTWCWSACWAAQPVCLATLVKHACSPNAVNHLTCMYKDGRRRIS